MFTQFSMQNTGAILTISKERFPVSSKKEALEKLQNVGFKALQSERVNRTLGAILRSKLPDSPTIL